MAQSKTADGTKWPNKQQLELVADGKTKSNPHIRLSIQSQPGPVCIQSERAQVSSLLSHFHSTADKRLLRVEVVLHLSPRF